ncbi:hypothetical protein [Shigella phage ESh9]|nr:hypothetical protein [Shigella phage ESh9]
MGLLMLTHCSPMVTRTVTPVRIGRRGMNGKLSSYQREDVQEAASL